MDFATKRDLAISGENLALVLDATHAIAAGRPRFELIAPDFVWDFSTAPGLWPEEQRYQGRKAVAEFLASWIGAWDELELEVEEAIDGDDRVILITRNIGKMSGSDALVEGCWAYLTTCREGLMVRTEVYVSREAALEAAGLSETVPSANRPHPPRRRLRSEETVALAVGEQINHRGRVAEEDPRV